jgi:gluconate 5-dehydrogenase
VMSEVARATTAPYTAAKGGIKMLTRSMAAEWAAHSIQANAIGPGYIETEMNRADRWFRLQCLGEEASAGRPLGRPDELIGTAVFLASHASNYVNGQMIFVDGGTLAVL